VFIKILTFYTNIINMTELLDINKLKEECFIYDKRKRINLVFNRIYRRNDWVNTDMNITTLSYG